MHLDVLHDASGKAGCCVLDVAAGAL